MMGIVRVLVENRSLPTKKLSRVFHVGSMNPSNKYSRMNMSYEGAGLSVSLHPDEWRKITKGRVTGPTWILEKPGGTFLDYHRLTQQQRTTIINWGVQQKLVRIITTYRVSYWDDELDDTINILFDQRDMAEEEAEMVDAEITEEQAPAPTPKLVNLMNLQNADLDDVDRFLGLAFDMLIVVYVEQVTQLDGVWWSDRLDPTAYSAPRGTIVNSRLGDWKTTKIKEDRND